MRHQAMKLLALLAAAVAAAGCGGTDPEPDGAPEPPGYLEGTVLALDGRPITAEDVDRYVPAVATIESEFALPSHRRKVLSNIVLPVAAGAALDPTRREEAFLEAQALLAAARETGEVAPDVALPQTLTGTFKDIGLAPWALAREMEPLTFSDLHETPGAWTFFRLIAVPPDGDMLSAHAEFTIVRYDVPYLPREDARALIDDALNGFEITIVDPEWEALVAPIYLYKSGSTPR
ncbi:MAG: hypothetical protein AAGB93_19350 [Planctomycetota bacterium]